MGRRVSDLEAVEQNNGLLAAILESSADAIFATDLDDVIRFWNLAAERLFGLRCSEAMGQRVNILPVSPPIEDLLRQLREVPGRADGGEYQAEIKRDGNPIAVSLTLCPIRKDGRDVVGTSFISRNLADKRQVQEGAARNERELNDMHSELRRVDTFASHFMVMTSHELRTPLTAILGYTQLLANGWDRIDDESKRDSIAVMRREGRRMARLVRNFEVAGHLDAGVVGKIDGAVGMARAVGAALVELETSDDVGVSCAPDLNVAIDAGHLHVMLVAYLTNALAHGRPPVEIEVSANGSYVNVEVLDRGDGPSNLVEPTLFDSFATITLPRARGFGLSLGIVREVARAYGGDAWFERRGKTTVFALRIPGHPVPTG